MGSHRNWDCKEHEIEMPRGGDKHLVGQYPEIQAHLEKEHQISALLTYISQLDELKINQDGKSDWTFHRQEAQVIVHDIPRVIWSIAVQ